MSTNSEPKWMKPFSIFIAVVFTWFVAWPVVRLSWAIFQDPTAGMLEIVPITILLLTCAFVYTILLLFPRTFLRFMDFTIRIVYRAKH